ncbi:uncharacterized protein V1518DRAFT_422614 [Limtongia smithiae]|uniref:uncharacterized protein n=1 Tax=Limtongia smithiae TaxID=1125753 RepID=UPI0034CFCF1C
MSTATAPRPQILLPAVVLWNPARADAQGTMQTRHRGTAAAGTTTADAAGSATSAGGSGSGGGGGNSNGGGNNDNIADEDSENTPNTVPFSSIRYTHNFDTYKMFCQLKAAGFTEEQAIVIMKCIRGSLSQGLVRARETYLSSAEMQNEAYLFDAAGSELRTEVQNSRKGQLNLAHAEIAALQREYVNLKVRYEEQIDVMKNEVKMDVDERKNASKIDSKTLQLQIQELNNRITISLSSGLRSEVEALRWQTTRRGLITIGIVAGLILTALSFRNEAELHAKAAATAASISAGEPVPAEKSADFGVEDVISLR